MKYKYKRTNLHFSYYECLQHCSKKGPSARCAQGVKLYPNGNYIPVGPGEHASNICYIKSGVKSPDNLVTEVLTIINIKEEIGDLTDKLALDNKAGNTLKNV